MFDFFVDVKALESRYSIKDIGVVVAFVETVHRFSYAVNFPQYLFY